MKITFISDTHNKHKQITNDLPGGDLLIHAGDISSMGYEHEVKEFCKWFNSLDQYTHKIFIPGNHDIGFEDYPDKIMEIVHSFKWITCLQDRMWNICDFESDTETPINLYGSPWQPEFCNWAFNLPRNGDALKEKWNAIPENTDILITHGPVFGHLDTVTGMNENLGCELLKERVNCIKPKIHISGHIHTGYGYKFSDGTHFINASILNEQYQYTQKPLNVEWNSITNEILFL